VAAALLTEWAHGWGLDPIVVHGTDTGLLTLAVENGRERAEAMGIIRLETLVRDDDEELRSILSSRDFSPSDDRGGVTWMPAANRPAVPPLPSGFELTDRTGEPDAPHPMVRRSGGEVAARLAELSLYDAELDLAVRHESGAIAGYALFWFDPVTRVGLVEPMRVEDAWQRRGLARALLLHGLERLAQRGASRFKVGYSTDPAKALYTGVGFEIDVTNTAWVRVRTSSRSDLTTLSYGTAMAMQGPDPN